MMVHVPAVLPPEAIERCRAILAAAQWADGKLTAGTQSEQVKNNRQLPQDGEACLAARAIVLEHLAKSALFFTATLPRRIFPPLFNRYEGAANAFGNHIDNAVRTYTATAQHTRTDISATLFLSEPADYDGGELVIEDTYGAHAVKLAAGDLIVYPGASLHRVEPVTRGARLASFFWIESMVRETERRRILFDMDMAILSLRQAAGDTAEAVKLTGCYHNLMRLWAQV